MPVFSGLKEVLLVRAIRDHEAVPIHDGNVVGRLSHFQVLRAKVAINDEGLHILPPGAPAVSSQADASCPHSLILILGGCAVAWSLGTLSGVPSSLLGR